MTGTPHDPPLDLSTEEIDACIRLLARKDRFLHNLRATGIVDHALLTAFVTNLVHLRHVSRNHRERAWRLAMSELVLAHANWLDAVRTVLDLPNDILAPLDAAFQHIERR